MDDMELFHVLNRGVDQRTIFLDDRDRRRFVNGLFQFNDQKPASNTRRSPLSMFDLRNRTNDERELIVDIHAWCLMKNHYHLLLSERVEGGITLFMRKLNIGYANYFNERHERSGALFQGRSKRKHIDSEAYFLHILHYIHLNPLDHLSSARDWRERRIRSSAEALRYLKNYQWSSYRDYCGDSNMPALLTTDLFGEALGNVEKETKQYLREIDCGPIASLVLE